MRLRRLALGLTMFWASVFWMGSAAGDDPKPVGGQKDSHHASESQAWDQADVTTLANELEQTLQEVYKGSLNAPRQATALQQRERDAAQSVIRRARDLSGEYARRMREGWDRESSNPYFRAVAGEVAHIWDTAGDAKPAKSAQPLIDRLQRILDKLRNAYDAP